MKATLLIFAVVMGQFVLVADKKLIADPIVEKAMRGPFCLNKPTGELTKADLEKVTVLALYLTKITDTGLKEVAQLQQLNSLDLVDTKVPEPGVLQLRKVLPKCAIYAQSN